MNFSKKRGFAIGSDGQKTCLSDAGIRRSIFCNTEHNQRCRLILIPMLPMMGGSRRRLIGSHAAVPHQPKLMLVLGKLHEIAGRYLSLPKPLDRNRLGHGCIHPLHPAICIKKPMVSIEVADIAQPFGSYLHLPAWILLLSNLRRFHHQHLARCGNKPKVFPRIDEHITHLLLNAHRGQQPLDITHVGILRQIKH